MDLESKLRDYYEAWGSQDPEAILQYFSEQSTFEDLAFASKFEGLAQIRSFIELTYAGVPDFQVTPQRIVVSDLAAAAAWTMHGTHQGEILGLPASQKKFQVRASSIVEFDKEGKILSIVDYWNPLEFRASIGLV